MTIYHPRVGFDIVEVNAGGINDPNDATASYYGQTVRMTKVNATEWAVW